MSKVTNVILLKFLKELWQTTENLPTQEEPCQPVRKGPQIQLPTKFAECGCFTPGTAQVSLTIAHTGMLGLKHKSLLSRITRAQYPGSFGML